MWIELAPRQRSGARGLVLEPYAPYALLPLNVACCTAYYEPAAGVRRLASGRASVGSTAWFSSSKVFCVWRRRIVSVTVSNRLVTLPLAPPCRLHTACWRR